MKTYYPRTPTEAARQRRRDFWAAVIMGAAAGCTLFIALAS